MDIREARYFLAVMRTRSFSRAARELNMTQPPLSQAIQRLERSTGLTLFDRNSRQVTPTRAAHALLAEVEALVRRSEELDQLQRRLRLRGDGDVPMHTVRIGAVPSVLLGLLPQIMPYVRGLNAQVYELNSVKQRELIDAGEIDVGFVREWPSADPRVRLVCEEPLVVALPEDHALASAPAISLTELAAEPFILFPREHAPAAFDAVTAACNGEGFTPDVQHTVNNDQAAFGLVACRLGVTLVPRMLTSLSCAGVVMKPVSGEVPTVPLGVISADGDPHGHGSMFAAAAAHVLEVHELARTR